MRLSFWPVVFALFASVALPASGKDDFAYMTKEGCGVARYAKAWVQANVASMSWNSECNKKKLTKGTGVLVVTLNDGSTERYEGEMKGGKFIGQGDYKLRDGTRKVGEFYDGWFLSGKIYRPDGNLWYDGAMYLYTHEYHIGKLYYSDGWVVEATFLEGAQNYNRGTGEGIDNGEVRDSAGRPIAWWVRGQRFNDQASYQTGLNRANDAQMAAQNAAAAAAQQQREQEDAAAWAQLGAALGAGATAQGGQQARLQAATNALQAPPPAKASGFTQGMLAGASRGAGGGTGAGFTEIRRGPARFDPSSTASDEAACVRVVIERPGRQTMTSNNTMEEEVWVLLKNDCNYDVWAMYCFTVTRNDSVCANYSKGQWMGHGTWVAVVDRDKRVNALFGGKVVQLDDPMQMVHVGACRYEWRDTRNSQSGSFIRGEHRFSQSTGLEYRCNRVP